MLVVLAEAMLHNWNIIPPIRQVSPDAEAKESALTDTFRTPLAPYCMLGILIAGKSDDVHFQASILFHKTGDELTAASGGANALE